MTEETLKLLEAEQAERKQQRREFLKKLGCNENEADREDEDFKLFCQQIHAFEVMDDMERLFGNK